MTTTAEALRVAREALEAALPRMAHKASCMTARPTTEWSAHGSVSFANCTCEIHTVRAALAALSGGEGASLVQHGERSSHPTASPTEGRYARPLEKESGRPLGCVKPDTAEQVFFYEQDFYVLSNFSAFTLVWQGIRFDTSEAAYHYEKFLGDEDGAMADMRAIRHNIRTAPSAHEAFKVAERNRAHRRPDWDDVKVGLMLDILRAKANQHEYVRRKLLATGDRELIEDSWRDDFWGWGPNRNGQNMLGKLWMQVRSELRASIAAIQPLAQEGTPR